MADPAGAIYAGYRRSEGDAHAAVAVRRERQPAIGDPEARRPRRLEERIWARRLSGGDVAQGSAHATRPVARFELVFLVKGDPGAFRRHAERAGESPVGGVETEREL